MDSKNLGKFIVIEGLDGSGKSTQAEAVAKALRERGLQVYEHVEPTRHPIGALIRQVLGHTRLQSVSQPELDQILLLLFKADRIYHLHNRIDGLYGAIKEGYWVICDRYIPSSYAYNCKTSEDIDFIRNQIDELLTPDLTVYLDVSSTVAIGRKEKDIALRELYETEEKLTEVRDRYKDYFKNIHDGACCNVDGNREKAEITKDILRMIDKATGQTYLAEEGNKKANEQAFAFQENLSSPKSVKREYRIDGFRSDWEMATKPVYPTSLPKSSFIFNDPTMTQDSDEISEFIDLFFYPPIHEKEATE